MPNIKITKGGFYFLSDFDNFLEIDVDDKVVIFDDGNNLIKKIEVLGKTDLKIYGFTKKTRNLEIVGNGEKTNILANYLFLGKDDNKIDAKVNGKIIKSGNSLEINILGILDDKSVLKLDSGVSVEPPPSPLLSKEWGIEQKTPLLIKEGVGVVSSGTTNTEIIFLGNDAKFSGIPGLKVASNNVKANHSLKIDKISDEAIFYLQARGIESDTSRNIILKAKVDELYKYFRLCNEKLYEEVLKEIFKK